ncbi:hypothetical protein [Marinoscillum sp.]|uniref:hypothetical protein n=1 Tax=Marinoscillum sp. TaxID=2024838 RepID=UPI003BAC0DE2
MKQNYTYLDYLAEVNNLNLSEHREYLNCMEVIKRHALKQSATLETTNDLWESRLGKLDSMINIHTMMIRRLQSGKSANELVRLN